MQVEELSAELHERKKKEKSRVEAETQTEEYIQVETGALTHTDSNFRTVLKPAVTFSAFLPESTTWPLVPVLN